MALTGWNRRLSCSISSACSRSRNNSWPAQTRLRRQAQTGSPEWRLLHRGLLRPAFSRGQSSTGWTFVQPVLAKNPLFLGRFLGRFDLLKILGRFGVEFLQAGFAAEFDLFALVRENVRIAHLAEFFAGDDAGGERIGLGGFLLFLSQHAKRRGHVSECQGDCSQCFQFFHTMVVFEPADNTPESRKPFKLFSTQRRRTPSGIRLGEGAETIQLLLLHPRSRA